MDERRHSLLWGIMAGIAFGTASIFIRAIALDSHTIAVARLAIACLFLILFLLAKERRVSVVKDTSVFFMGIFLALHFLFFVSAVKDTTIMAATVLVNTVPIITMMLGRIFLRTRASRVEILSVLLCFAGIVVIAGNDAGKGSLVGDVEALLAAFCEAVYLLIGARLRQTRDAVPIMIPTYAVAVAVLLVSWRSVPAPEAFTTSTMLLLLAVGIIPTAFGHTLFVASLKSLKAYQSATLAMLEPISASALALFFFSEIPSPVSLVGSCVIFIGIYLLFSGEGR